jgi:hypothetical protein
METRVPQELVGIILAPKIGGIQGWTCIGMSINMDAIAGQQVGSLLQPDIKIVK